ncbi:MAG: hypothetical protein R3275_08160 [Saprospiraceae bacterium]|nr:hypothetical protein [Saprospiraceae bacterium]
MRLFFVWLIGLPILFSCSPNLTPMTNSIVKDMRWGEDEFRRIQFYLSDDIVLRREVRSGDASIREGKVKLVNGRKIEEIIFEKGTPGVFEFSPDGKDVAISFERGGDNRYLMFGPNPKYNDRYVLLARDWDRRKGQITYDGKTYNTSSESAFASLMIDLERARKSVVESRKARGRTVN